MDVGKLTKLLNTTFNQVSALTTFFHDVHRIADALERISDGSGSDGSQTSGKGGEGVDLLVESAGVDVDDDSDQLMKIAIEMLDEYENNPGRQEVGERAQQLLSVIFDRSIRLKRTGLGVDVVDKRSGESLSNELADHR